MGWKVGIAAVESEDRALLGSLRKAEGSGNLTRMALRPFPPLIWAASTLVALAIGWQCGLRQRTQNETAAHHTMTRGSPGTDESTGATSSEAHPRTLSKEWAERALPPEEARQQIHEALSAPNDFQRRRRFYEVLAGLSPENWEDVLQSFIVQTTQEGRKHDHEWHATLVRIGEVAGRQALERFLKSHGANPGSHEVAQCLKGWAATDPQAARAWYEQEADGPRKQFLGGYLVDGLVQSDPQKAAEFVAKLGGGTAGAQASGLVDGIIQTGGLAAATRVFDTMRKDAATSGDPSFAEAYFHQLTERIFYANWVGKTPERACQWVADPANAAFVTPDLIAHGARDYAERNPQAALAWVEAIGATQEIATVPAVHRLTEQWANKDLPGLGQWLEANREHPFHDPMASSMVYRLAQSDPATAREWLGTIQNAELRSQVQQELDRRNPAPKQ